MGSKLCQALILVADGRALWGGGVRALVDESSSSCRGERALLRDSLQRSEGTGNQTNLISSSHSWGFVQDEGGECTSLGKNSSIP